MAKNIVAAGLADRAEVQVAYAIGVARPLSVLVETFGTERVPRSTIRSWSTSTSTCARPRSAATSSCTPDLPPTAAYGHFGRTDPDLPWERTDRADALREAAGLTAAVPAAV